MKIFGSIQELVELVYRIGSNTVTLKPNASQATSINVSLPVLTSDDTVVTNTSTVSFSNKTINLAVGNNTISQMTVGSFGQSLSDANKVLLRDVNGTVQHAKIADINVDAAAAIALTKLATVTASRALQSDGSGNISASSITSTELGHLSGVTSNIQTQLNSKEGTITVLPISKGGTNSSTSLNNNRVMISSGSAIVEASALTASRALASDASGLPTASATTSTELGYLSGVTSAVQTQINAKADTTALTAHTGASSGVHGVTGSVVGTTDTQVLTNKDHDGGTASNASRFTLPKANKSILDGLTRKQATLVYGTDTNKVYADDGSTLREIGSGSSGINYLSAQYAADALGTVELNVGDTLASSTRSSPNQWGNSAASALITQSTDSTLRGTTNYLVAFSANAQFVESPLFSIDGEDLGKPLLVQFDVSGVGTADDVQVYVARYNSSNVLQERILVAGTASATSPNSAQVPTNTTTFRGFFIPSSTATDKYAIRWRRNANNTSMRLDTFFVGPQSLAQGAVVTAWQSYTPTFTGFGTPTSIEMYWRRVGSTLEVKGNFTTGTNTATEARMSLPSGLTTDSFPSIVIAGPAIDAQSSATYFGAYLLAEPSQTYFTFGMQFSTLNGLSKTNANNFASSAKITLTGSVQISQWSSGTTTLADRAVEEYASNSSATDADDTGTSNFVFSVSGSAGVLGATNLTDMRKKRIRFTTPILPTDKIEIEISPDGIYWYPMIGYRDNSSSIYATPTLGIYNGTGTTSSSGISYERISGSNTDIYVVFGRYQTNMPAYTNAWGGFTGHRFRVRKVSGGAAVGFPVSARNIVGDTSGTAVPSGYVGEIIGATLRSGTNGFTYTTSLSGGGSWTNNAPVSMGTQVLNKGTYLACINSSATLAAGATRSFDLQLFIGGTNITPNFYYSNPAVNTGSADIQMILPICITADNVTVDIRGRVTGGNDTIAVYGQMSFVRIA